LGSLRGGARPQTEVQALAKVREAEAVPNRSGENHLIEQMRAAAQAGDRPGDQASLALSIPGS
jgi:hypothetical protein